MGLMVEVFRWSLRDCTNGGASSKHNRLCITNMEGPFDPSDNCPAAQLVAHPTVKGHCYIVPQETLDSGRWYMMGGNFAHSSDSRFHEAIKKMTGNNGCFAVGIHDRVED
jgi:hypothetical protein